MVLALTIYKKRLSLQAASHPFFEKFKWRIIVKKLLGAIGTAIILLGCKKDHTVSPPAQSPFDVQVVTVNDSVYTGHEIYNVATTVAIKFLFSVPVNEATVPANITLVQAGSPVPGNYSYGNHDSSVTIQAVSPLKPLTAYIVAIYNGLKSASDSSYKNGFLVHFVTAIDTTDKFPRIGDSALLTLVEQQTFNYFWGLAHPGSGMALERATSGDVCATGGTGMGIMSMLVAAQRNFITRAQALGRVDTIVQFLSTKATVFHGAFSHWINGSTGATIPFSTEDDGADLVETSYLMAGLLSARQFFNSTTDAGEISLRAAINNLWNGVDWGWFRQSGQNTLYWHWSPDYGWSTNQQINGWDEALITYILAASANADSIPKVVYDNGWAENGGIKNGNSYYGIQLPLGPPGGGPLFFAHYTFLGVNPNGLSDAYANYWTQDTAHANINYDYCVANPLHYNGYSSQCWGLTAGDDNISGYSAHSPTNDLGVISPTAAISSMPYTPVQSMNALRFFYYKLGDKIWGQYGFVDAFNLSTPWYDNDYLAIDQGPEIVMIENYRSGLIWNLLMSCPEIQRGLQRLGFQGPGI